MSAYISTLLLMSIYIYIYIYMYIYIFICIYIYTHIGINIENICIQVSTHMYVCMHACRYSCLHVCIHTCINAYTDIYTCVYMYTFMYMHTYRHVCTRTYHKKLRVRNTSTPQNLFRKTIAMTTRIETLLTPLYYAMHDYCQTQYTAL